MARLSDAFRAFRFGCAPSLGHLLFFLCFGQIGPDCLASQRERGSAGRPFLLCGQASVTLLPGRRFLAFAPAPGAPGPAIRAIEIAEAAMARQSLRRSMWAHRRCEPAPDPGKPAVLGAISMRLRRSTPVNGTPAKIPRNPLRNEADMFRVLIMFGAGAAIVIAVALVIGSLAGAIVAAVLVAVGLWRTWGLIQDWRRYGSGPGGRQGGGTFFPRRGRRPPRPRD